MTTPRIKIIGSIYDRFGVVEHCEKCEGEHGVGFDGSHRIAKMESAGIDVAEGKHFVVCC